MIRMLKILLLFIGLPLAGTAQAQGYFATTLHAFQGPEGAQPVALAAAADGSFYGVSQSGNGAHGALFRVQADGSVQVLHVFNGSDGSLRWPNCCTAQALARLLVAPGGDVYGYTLTGGNSNCQSGYGCGVVFRYSQAGVYTVLWRFTGGADGSRPTSLVWGSDGYLYGSSYGLPDNNGAVFRLSTAGSLQVLHSFCSQPNCSDGYAPGGLSEGPDHNFYGHYKGNGGPDYVYRITPAGVITPLVPLLPGIGDNWGDGAGNFVTGSDGGIYFTFDSDNYGSGRVDRYDIGSNTLTMLYQFRYTDGGPPFRLLVGPGNAIHGTALTGGRQGLGTSFRIDSAGKLSFLYDFQGTIDGAWPLGLAAAPDGRLYGMAYGGGLPPPGSNCSDCGTFFQLALVPAGAPAVSGFNAGSGPAGTTITLSGNQFTGLQSLRFGSVAATFQVQNDQQLTATVPAGLQQPVQMSLSNAAGTGYVMDPFQPSASRYATLYGFCAGGGFPDCNDGAGPVNLIQSSDGNFYGTTAFNFPSSVLFKLSPGGAFSVLAKGLNIPNPITESGGALYGTSIYGGYRGTLTGCNDPENPVGCGTLFKVDKTTGLFTTLHRFKGNADGAFPQSNLVAVGGTGTLYGSTPTTLFKYQGRSLRTLRTFTPATDGNGPAMLLDGGDGNLYGVNSLGGAAGQGTVFRLNLASNVFTVLHSFAANEGSKPVALARAADGTLYGATQGGGGNGKGTLFRITAAGSFSTIYGFKTGDVLGSAPGMLRIGKDGALYGTTTGGASLGGGTVFRMATDGSGGTPLYAFFSSNTASGHGWAPTSLFQGSNGDWFGTTYYGGATSCYFGTGCGVIFQIK